MSIADEIARIRQEQARASDREWRVCSPQAKDNDSAKYLDIPKGTSAPYIYTPFWGAICMPAPHSPQYALCIPNMNYIARTCDPKSGHLTRVLAALEACVAALDALARNGISDDIAPAALTKAEALLRGD